ncbi:hypothetical protein BGK67_00790 [Streptomyces subrutilus]|uniref:Uncharacterized protein n=1 Tax=Streptomyces subrutilus TaxID=36818 RepID=A0A1E5PKL2_9ACTN|nr:hypothetical protein BGK67_00790 [Streptomyces subrutilus]
MSAQAERALEAFLDAQARAAIGPEHASAARDIEDLIAAGGKRIRPRLCVLGWYAAGFAWAEAVILLSTIAGRFTLRLAPGARIRPAAGFVLHPDHLPVTLQRRRR